MHTYHGYDTGYDLLVEGLQLQGLEDQVVAAVLQQLFAKVLWWVQVFAGRVLPLALALQQANRGRLSQELCRVQRELDGEAGSMENPHKNETAAVSTRSPWTQTGARQRPHETDRKRKGVGWGCVGVGVGVGGHSL